MAGGLLMIYGPFKRDGKHTSESNAVSPTWQAPARHHLPELCSAAQWVSSCHGATSCFGMGLCHFKPL